MTLILGIDIATTTGCALYDPAKNISAIDAWSFKVKGESHEQKAYDMGLRIIEILKEKRPTFVALEAPKKNLITHRKTVQTLVGDHDEAAMNPASVILPNQLTGAVLAVLAGFGLPFCTIPDSTWRKQFLGFGRKPGWQSADWKRASRDRCDQLGVHVTNNDQSDAVGVAFAAPSHEAFKMMTRNAA